MFEFEVAKPFNTVNRRLAVGAVVLETDDLTPFSFDERRERGFIQPKKLPRDADAAAATPAPRRSPVSGSKADAALSTAE